MSSASAYGDVQAFQILFLVAVASRAVLALVALIGFGVYVLFGNSFHVVRSASRSVREAERSSRAAIETAEHLRTVTRSILRKARKIISPRLVVVTVATDLWQPAVQQLAARVSMILIDVSERTENLLWEIQNVLPKLGPRCILIGHYDKVCRLATNGPHAAPRGLVAAHLASLLDDREVLAYTNDDQGMRRFARALQAKLEDARIA